MPYVDHGTLFILESFLAYLISMAAGLRTSAIGDKAQQRLKRDLESISQKIQDQNQSRLFEESLELIPIDAAKLKHRLNDAFIDGPVTNLCVDEQFQKGITDYFLEKDTRARNALEKKLKTDIVAAFLDAGATKEQAGYNGGRFFELIQRRVFADQDLFNFLLYGEVRHFSERQERQTDKLDAIHRDIKKFDATRLPLQRPRRAEHFTGREQELEKLLNDLQPGKTVTVCGTGGIGKSALAAEAVWHLAPSDEPPERFPDGVIYHDFYLNPLVEQALEHVVRSFGEEPEPTATEAARRVLAGRKALLLIDGAEDADDLPRLLSVTDTCSVLVTSQKRDDAVAEPQDLDPLPGPKAMSLLQSWCGSAKIDENTGRRICELLGCLPLAVRLAGRYMSRTGEQPKDYLAWLKDSPLEALNWGERRSRSVPLLLDRCIAKVSKPSHKALFVTGLLANAMFKSTVVAAALDIKSVTARIMLGELVSFGLLLKQSKGEGYVVSHRLIHTYTSQNCQLSTEVTERLVSFYITFAREQEQEGQVGYTRLDAERAHLLRLSEVCEQEQLWQHLIDLVSTLNNFLDLQGFRSDQLSMLNRELMAAKRLKNKSAECAILGNLGIAYGSVGDFDKAISCFNQSLLISRMIDNRNSECSSIGNLGLIYRNLGNVEKSIECHEQALAIAREIGDLQGEGGALGGLGIGWFYLYQYDKTIEYCKQAIAISHKIGDRKGENANLGNLGNAYMALGHLDKAVTYYDQALSISRKIGERRSESNHLGSLGVAYMNLAQFDKAIEHFKQALAISREIGHRQGEGNLLGNIGLVYHHTGQAEKAIVYYKHACGILNKISDRMNTCIFIHNLGIAYSHLGLVKIGVEYHEQALSIAREIGDHHKESDELRYIGLGYKDLAQFDKAIEHFKQALAISREIGDRQGEGSDLGNLGNAYHALGQVEKARECYKQSLSIFEEIKSPYAENVRKWLTEMETNGN